MFKNKFNGKFIAIEGLSGSGASTQASKIKNYLLEQKKQTIVTSEPTTGVIGGITRAHLTGEWKIESPLALQLLFAADRANHLEREIIPALEQGTNVISDRYFFSSIAYGSLDISDQDWLYQINNQFILPDLTILIKISAKTSQERIKSDDYDIKMFDQEEKLQKIWKTYEMISNKYPNIKIIDGEKSEEEIFEEIKKEVDKIIK